MKLATSTVVHDLQEGLVKYLCLAALSVERTVVDGLKCNIGNLERTSWDTYDNIDEVTGGRVEDFHKEPGKDRKNPSGDLPRGKWGRRGRKCSLTITVSQGIMTNIEQDYLETHRTRLLASIIRLPILPVLAAYHART